MEKVGMAADSGEVERVVASVAETAVGVAMAEEATVGVATVAGAWAVKKAEDEMAEEPEALEMAAVEAAMKEVATWVGWRAAVQKEAGLVAVPMVARVREVALMAVESEAGTKVVVCKVGRLAEVVRVALAERKVVGVQVAAATEGARAVEARAADRMGVEVETEVAAAEEVRAASEEEVRTKPSHRRRADYVPCSCCQSQCKSRKRWRRHGRHWAERKIGFHGLPARLTGSAAASDCQRDSLVQWR